MLKIKEGEYMKKICINLLCMFVFVLHGSDWTTSALDIEQAMAAMGSSLMNDIDCFTAILQNIGEYTDSINQFDGQQQQFFTSLQQNYEGLVESYAQSVQTGQQLQETNASDIQQLHEILVDLQASTQNQIVELNQQYLDAQNILNQLNIAYANEVQENTAEAQGIMNLLRYICTTYSTMIVQKEACLGSLNKILGSLNVHIENEYQRIAHLANTIAP